MVQLSASNLQSDTSPIDTFHHKRNKVGEGGKIWCISLTCAVKINPTESWEITSCYTIRTPEDSIIKATLFLSSVVSLNWLSGDILPLT